MYCDGFSLSVAWALSWSLAWRVTFSLLLSPLSSELSTDLTSGCSPLLHSECCVLCCIRTVLSHFSSCCQPCFADIAFHYICIEQDSAYPIGIELALPLDVSFVLRETWQLWSHVYECYCRAKCFHRCIELALHPLVYCVQVSFSWALCLLSAQGALSECRRWIWCWGVKSLHVCFGASDGFPHVHIYIYIYILGPFSSNPDLKFINFLQELVQSIAYCLKIVAQTLGNMDSNTFWNKNIFYIYCGFKGNGLGRKGLCFVYMWHQEINQLLELSTKYLQAAASAAKLQNRRNLI